MKIVKKNPPNYERITEVFNLSGRTPVFTYGDTLYNPGGGQIDAPLMAHEETHAEQQGDKVEEWWEQYLTDSQFRLIQEVQAYRRQFALYCAENGDRNARAVFLHHLASDLSSPMYGNCASYSMAKKLINNV